GGGGRPDAGGRPDGARASRGPDAHARGRPQHARSRAGGSRRAHDDRGEPGRAGVTPGFHASRTSSIVVSPRSTAVNRTWGRMPYSARSPRADGRELAAGGPIAP